MPVITIRGQMGSGAPEIGKLIAASLGIDYIDREIIADVAGKLNYPAIKIEKQEMPPTSLFKRIKDVIEHSYPSGPDAGGLGSAMIYVSPEQVPLDDTGYRAALETIIKEIAVGDAVVIRGRGSQFILKDHPGALHILTVASPETRIQRVMQNRNIDEKAARQEINNFDNSRREFIKRYFRADLESPVNYDIVFNTDHLAYPAVVTLVNSLLALRQPGPGS